MAALENQCTGGAENYYSRRKGKRPFEDHSSRKKKEGTCQVPFHRKTQDWGDKIFLRKGKYEHVFLFVFLLCSVPHVLLGGCAKASPTAFRELPLEWSFRETLL